MTHLLIADDSAVMRKIVIRTLRQAGFAGLEITEAEDGQDLLDKAIAISPDLILSDWNMPNMTGIEALRAVRAAGSMVPFGFVTSESSESMRSEAESAGAAFLVTKPFTAEVFESALGAYVS
ncbi:response regulator [Jatrophihabitans telluris]|uniref:Response regulator n=1 Tax=Jatrophihabitans telluris TaxID=2038343 RepID=A0ABY4R346_9ACTN|nr:response regulator [Jatrophihabitans telluris]UQX89581.1 response regulator [Jatrophihabitans telluris]